jgi:malate dehydrogenase (oxaloacetate-decarboxylating)(NADP+)
MLPAAEEKRGIDLLHDPALNKATGFTEAERDALGLVGLIPDMIESEDFTSRRSRTSWKAKSRWLRGWPK